MNTGFKRFLALSGILLVLILSIWYFMKTYNEGNPQYIYIILAVGIAILFSLNLPIGRRKD